MAVSKKFSTAYHKRDMVGHCIECGRIIGPERTGIEPSARCNHIEETVEAFLERSRVEWLHCGAPCATYISLAAVIRAFFTEICEHTADAARCGTEDIVCHGSDALF